MITFPNEEPYIYHNPIQQICQQLSSCLECKTKFNMPDGYCCLMECGEHEWCKYCEDKGIYHLKFKELEEWANNL